jgi:hypothetical protein
MRGQGPWAELFSLRFKKAMARLGMERKSVALRTDLFRPPEGAQLRLF